MTPMKIYIFSFLSDILDDRSIIKDLPWLENLETVYNAARYVLEKSRGVKFVNYVK